MQDMAPFVSKARQELIAGKYREDVMSRENLVVAPA